MKTAISKNNLFLAMMPTINGVILKTLDNNKIEDTTSISWTSLLNNAACHEGSKALNMIAINMKNACVTWYATSEMISIAAHETETDECCLIQPKWEEIILDCIRHRSTNDVNAISCRNDKNNVSVSIKRANEIEKITIGEENMENEIAEIHITPGMIPTTEEDNTLTEMGELQETINMLKESIKELEEDKELQKLLKQMEKINERINTKRDELGITQLGEEKFEYESTLSARVTEFASSIDEARWGPNQFTKGKKKEFSSKNGIVSILKSTRTVRRINTKRLLDTNPLFIQKLAEEGRLGVTLAEAEKDMSKNEIDEVADKTVTATYELYVKGQGPK